MYKDYYVALNQNPALDAVLTFFNPIFLEPIYFNSVGLGFNTLEICTNANANTYFISYFVSLFNNDGATRRISFQSVTGVELFGYSVASGVQGLVMSDRYHVFNRLRPNTGAAAVTNAATAFVFRGLKFKI